MDIEHVVPADIFSHLPDSLDKGTALDITHRAPDLSNNHISPGTPG